MKFENEQEIVRLTINNMREKIMQEMTYSSNYTLSLEKICSKPWSLFSYVISPEFFRILEVVFD